MNCLHITFKSIPRILPLEQQPLSSSRLHQLLAINCLCTVTSKLLPRRDRLERSLCLLPVQAGTYIVPTASQDDKAME